MAGRSVPPAIHAEMIHLVTNRGVASLDHRPGTHGSAMGNEFRKGSKPLLAGFFAIAFLAMPYGTMGSFIGPIAKTLGWNFGQIQLALIGYGAIVAVGTLIIGPFCDRLGSRLIVLFAATGFGLTFASLSLTRSLTWFYSGYLLLGLMAVGLSPVVLTHTINQWFVHRRGLALGILMSAAGIANFVMPSITVALMGRLGWRKAYAVLGISALAVCLPLLWEFFHAPRRTARPNRHTQPLVATLHRQFLRNRAFWLTCVAGSAVAIAYSGVYVNLQVLLGLRGFAPGLAAAIAGLTGAAIIVGRLFTGFLLDRVPAPLIALPLFSLPAIACFFLGVGYSSVPFVVCAVLSLGCALGAEGDLMPYVIGRYIDFRSYATAFAIVYSAYQAAVSVSPAIYGYIFHLYGTYTPALFGSAGFFLVAAVLMMLLGPHPSRIDAP
jgi:OFA family oxalate/formate antiporter-like MFS transporter